MLLLGLLFLIKF